MSVLPAAINTRNTPMPSGAAAVVPLRRGIDVRSPCEFAESSGAVLPVLSDAERVWDDLPRAGRLPGPQGGPTFASPGTSEHFASKGKDYRPFVYCAAGSGRPAWPQYAAGRVAVRSCGGYKTGRVRRELTRCRRSSDFGSSPGQPAGQDAAHAAVRGLGSHLEAQPATAGRRRSRAAADAEDLGGCSRRRPPDTGSRCGWVENRVGTVLLPPVLRANAGRRRCRNEGARGGAAQAL